MFNSNNLNVNQQLEIDQIKYETTQANITQQQLIQNAFNQPEIKTIIAVDQIWSSNPLIYR